MRYLLLCLYLVLFVCLFVFMPGCGSPLPVEQIPPFVPYDAGTRPDAGSPDAGQPDAGQPQGVSVTVSYEYAAGTAALVCNGTPVCDSETPTACNLTQTVTESQWEYIQSTAQSSGCTVNGTEVDCPTTCSTVQEIRCCSDGSGCCQVQVVGCGNIAFASSTSCALVLP